jgi:NADPH:quinone reductase-like Zn-dependent oxidoreductase
MALDYSELSPRELAVRFTDEKRYFESEATVYRLLKAHDLITSPAYVVIKAAGEVGEGAHAFAPGDHVVRTFHPNWADGHIDRAELDNSPGGPVDGFACEEATRPASHFTRAPTNLDHLEAATLPCAGVTAWRAVATDGQVKPGEYVLVQGTGSVSLFALQFAKAAGAIVIATSSSVVKLERLKALGASHVVNYVETPEWGQVVLAGRGKTLLEAR